MNGCQPAAHAATVELVTQRHPTKGRIAIGEAGERLAYRVGIGAREGFAENLDQVDGQPCRTGQQTLSSSIRVNG